MPDMYNVTGMSCAALFRQILGLMLLEMVLNFLKTTALNLVDMLPGLSYVILFTKLLRRENQLRVFTTLHKLAKKRLTNYE